MFAAVEKQSLSDSVYRQLKRKIVNRELAAGEELPGERSLSEMFGVNRNSVREAIKRLQQAGLVEVRHGGNHMVLDYRQEAGLELLPSLVIDERGQLDAEVVRGIMSLRGALAPEVAAAAAEHGGRKLAQQLEELLAQMREADLPTLQQLAMQFWSALVDAGGNIAFRLAFNSMNKTYRGAWEVLRGVLEPELRDLERLAAIAAAVRMANPDAARRNAREHVAIGSQAMDSLLSRLPKKKA